MPEDEEKEVTYDRENYHYLTDIIGKLEKATEKKASSESLEDRLALIKEWRNPDKPHMVGVQNELMDHFLHVDDSVYNAAKKKLYDTLEDENKKLGESSDDEKVWAIVDAFIEQALKKIYGISDDDWADFKKRVAKTDLPPADAENEDALKKQLRTIYNQAIGNPESGDTVVARYEILYQNLTGKSRGEAQQVLNAAATVAHQAHYGQLEKLLEQKLVGDKKHDLMNHVLSEAEKAKYESKIPWAQRNLNNLVQSALLYDEAFGPDAIGKTHKQLGYYKMAEEG